VSTEQLNKVAKITLIFWLMKIVATTLGETLGVTSQLLQVKYGKFPRGLRKVEFNFKSDDLEN
jgi:hypothetical protein